MAFLDAAGVTRLCQDLKSRFAEASHTHSEYQVKLVSGTSIKTVNGTSLLGSGNIDTSELPTVTSSDNGNVLQVVNGAWAAASAPSGGSDSGVTYAVRTSRIPVTAWNDTTATVNESAVTETNDVIVSPEPGSISDWISAGVCCVAQGEGTLTFECSSVPDSALTVNLLIFEGGSPAPVLSKTVSISLTNPLNASGFNEGSVVETATLDIYDEHATEIAVIDTPTYTSTITMSQDMPYLFVRVLGLSVGGGSVTTTDGVSYEGNLESGVYAFQVDSSGTITIDEIDYDD